MMGKLKSSWDKFWFSEIAAIRPYLLRKAVLLLVAFDCWVLLSKRGWRYGLDGFNIAHFGWLDAIQPMPSAELYVGLVLTAGIVSFISAFTRPSRWIIAIPALTYTYAWAMSLIDGYQHHYLLSLLLFLIIFLPNLNASDLYSSDNKQNNKFNITRIISWAYVLLAVNVSIVYFYTAIAKIDQEWFSGWSLRSIGGIQVVLSPLEFELAYLDISLEAFWHVIAVSIIAGELLLSLLYLLATARDRITGKYYKIAIWIGFALGLGFHLGLEYFYLSIGWFSYYMASVACVYYLPESVLWRFGSLITYPERKIESGLNKISSIKKKFLKIIITMLVTALAVLFGIYAGQDLDLPGAVIVSYVVVSSVLVFVVVSIYKRAYKNALTITLTVSLAFIMMWFAIANSEARTSFYKGLGYHKLKRNEFETAYRLLKKANKYETDTESIKQKHRERVLEYLEKKLNIPE